MSQNKIDKTLKHNDFPHKFYVKYAVACAKLALANNPHPDSLKALALAERFSLGENIPQEELKAAADAAYAYAYAHAYAAAYAAHAASASAAAAAAAAYAAAYTADATSSSDKLYELLLTMIDNEFSEFEKLLLNYKIY